MVLKLTHVSVIDTLLGQIAVVRGSVPLMDALSDPSVMGGHVSGILPPLAAFFFKEIG